MSGPAPRVGPRDPVLTSLGLLSVLGEGLAGFIVVMPNRLVSGRSVALAALPVGALALALLPSIAALVVGILSPPARHRAAKGVLTAAWPLATAIAAGIAADSRAGWIGLGAGFWIALSASLLAIGHVGRGGIARGAAGRRAALAAQGALVLGAAWAYEAGRFDRLSLIVAFRDHQALFAQSAIRHVALCAATIAIACLIGLPLGALASLRPRIRPPLYLVLNTLQTIPSIAAFGLLIAPLSSLASAFPVLGRLGIAGIGVTPALIALVAYALLPIARNADAGLSGVDPGVRDAARGMGYAPASLVARVTVPLALPAILAGIRVASVQTIGLATIAALIGAGGFGVFVFDGTGQYATDLVLLGALPVTILALAASGAIGALERAIERGR